MIIKDGNKINLCDSRHTEFLIHKDPVSRDFFTKRVKEKILKTGELKN